MVPAAVKAEEHADVPPAARKFFLVDSNVVIGYYLPQAAANKRVDGRARVLIDFARKNKGGPVFMYISNFCVAEVFNVFNRWRFGKWNRKVRKAISPEEHKRAVSSFRRDIHNAAVFYNYELARYHVLNTDLISPIDNHYAFYRGTKKVLKPLSTHDLLIVGMGIELAHTHGWDSFHIVTADSRICDILTRARKLRAGVRKKLRLDSIARRLGVAFSRHVYPQSANLGKMTKAQFRNVFGLEEQG